MSEGTGIQWTDHTFNPWWGCDKVSPGCKHCYAETWDSRFGGEHWGAKAPRRFFGDKHWNEPRKWNAAAEKAGKRARVFCASMADVFEDRRDLDTQRSRLWALITETPWLDWQLLTKRPENVPLQWPVGDGAWPHNVWLGTTVEDRERLGRVTRLVAIPARTIFLSCEPLLEDLGAIDLIRHVNWIIIGGESGAGARPMDLGWARHIVNQSRCPVFVKQLGGFPDKRGEPAFWPEDLRIREFPE